MPSSTSSSDPPGLIDLERPVPALRFAIAVVTALFVFAAALAGWELYWRGFGAVAGYRNSEGLWAIQRGRIDHGEGDATVLLGSSRMLSDLQLPVWERLDGRRPIQLSLEGTSPIIPLEDLANDPDFTGKLLVGVTPGLLFSGYAYRGDVFEYYRQETPSQRAGQRLSMWLMEPWLAFYDPDFALFTVLKRQPWPERPGAAWRREVRKLFVGDADRNSRLWSKVEHDPEYRALAQRIWAQGWRAKPDTARLAAQRKLREEQLQRATAAVARLRARGIEVIFIRHPSAGPFLANENELNPRAETWDVLLRRTGARGIHFEDHAALQGFTLPEWSHLTAADADRYTEALYGIVEGMPQAPLARGANRGH